MITADPIAERLIRVFPRRTRATPIDDLVAVNRPPGFFDYADKIHISVAFEEDLKKSERLEKEWRHVAPVEIGGPATGERGADFVPGKYLKPGYVITSRGCPNKCWFCSVWKREGSVRELPITQGHNVLDDNLLACSPEHIQSVFRMLSKQKEKPLFTGGLEAARLTPEICIDLKKLKPKSLFFAYDTPDDLPHLSRAGEMLLEAGFTEASHTLRSYVLIGYKGDTIQKAQKRLDQAKMCGFLPMAMLLAKHAQNKEWVHFQCINANIIKQTSRKTEAQNGERRPNRRLFDGSDNLPGAFDGVQGVEKTK